MRSACGAQSIGGNVVVAVVLLKLGDSLPVVTPYIEPPVLVRADPRDDGHIISAIAFITPRCFGFQLTRNQILAVELVHHLEEVELDQDP